MDTRNGTERKGKIEVRLSYTDVEITLFPEADF